jgi:hypothetical protein
VRNAVLFIVFNRPGTTRLVFDAIRAAKPPRLYVAADGFRVDKLGEKERCEEVKRISTSVDWPCELMTLFRDENLGCKFGPANAIDWFFEHEEEGIILEDDVLPLPSFFSFCDQLLERYHYNEQIMMISGCNLIAKRFRPIESYSFIRHTHIWGWATWRRAWSYFDVSMQSWPAWKAEGGLLKVVNGDPLIESSWANVFDAVLEGRIDAWDYQWTYACWRFGGLSVLSEFNLTRNIGFGDDATHTVMQPPKCVTESIPQEVSFPLTHPNEIHKSNIADNLIERYVYGMNRTVL